MASLEPDSISALVRKVYVVLIALSLLFYSGCRAVYIFHAASGQYNLLRNSIKIEEALKTESMDDEVKSRLRLVPEIKKFGEEKLGLKKSDNYNTVYMKSEMSPIYVLSACPKDSLKGKTWWFPVVGKMPYLGFFDMKRAERKMNELKDDNLDVSIRVAGAYSTLGWFDDPVTLGLLKGSTVDLVETILHEMTHTSLYIKGNGAFNEGLANLVGKTGAILFIRNRYGPAHPFYIEAENNLHDELLFSEFINSIINDLKKVYSSDLSYDQKINSRNDIFKECLQRHYQLKEKYKTKRFSRFGTDDLNNAYLLSIALYRQEFQGFYTVLMKNNNSVPDLIASLKEEYQKE